jgi:hypothetical protein
VRSRERPAASHIPKKRTIRKYFSRLVGLAVVLFTATAVRAHAAAKTFSFGSQNQADAGNLLG